MILDVIFAVILLLCVWYGAHRGFVKTAMGVVSLFAGLIAAIYLYKPFMSFLYSLPAVAGWLNQAKAGIASAIMPVVSDTAQKQLPAFLNSFLSADVLQQGKAAVADAAAGLILSAALMVAFILAVKLCIAICIRVMGVVTKLPLLKQVNSLLGGVLGGVNGILFCFIAATILFVMAGYPQNAWISDSLAQSYIAKYFYESNLLIKLV